MLVTWPLREILTDCRNDLDFWIMHAMSQDEPRAKRWKPWQFSLRLLFQLMLVTAAFFGGWVANDWKREREAEAEWDQPDFVSFALPSWPVDSASIDPVRSIIVRGVNPREKLDLRE
jgi:hypothetical protein